MNQNSTNPAPPHRLGDLSAAGCSHSALRHVFLNHELVPGSRLLVFGDRDHGLVSIANSLGVEALSCSPDELGDLPESWQQGSVDAVVIRSSGAHDENLRSVQTLECIATLVKCLRTGGHLVILPQVGSRFAQHQHSCYARLLQCLDGEYSERTIVPRWGRFSAWFGRKNQAEFVSSLKVPDPISARDGWLGQFTLRHPSLQTACCDLAGTAAASSLEDVRAA